MGCNGVFRRGRLLATTTNANLNIAGDTLSTTAFTSSLGGDVYVAGSFVNGFRFLEKMFDVPVHFGSPAKLERLLGKKEYTDLEVTLRRIYAHVREATA